LLRFSDLCDGAVKLSAVDRTDAARFFLRHELGYPIRLNRFRQGQIIFHSAALKKVPSGTLPAIRYSSYNRSSRSSEPSSVLKRFGDPEGVLTWPRRDFPIRLETAMKSGQITINGISDNELIKILEVKAKHEGGLIFNPQQMQANVQLTHPNKPPVQPKDSAYNNVILQFSNENGLKAVREILHHLVEELICCAANLRTNLFSAGVGR
jgi:hypothetical protein